MKMWKAILFALIIPGAVASSAQDGNGDFFFYKNYEQVIAVTREAVRTSAIRLSGLIKAAPPRLFSALPKPVNQPEMSRIVAATGIEPFAFKWRVNPDGYTDLLRMDYSVQQKTITVLGPMVIAAYYMEPEKAALLLQKSMLLEVLHIYGYKQDEAMKVVEILSPQLIPGS